MLVQMKLSDQDAADPKVQALLDQAGWEPAGIEESGWYQLAVGMPYEARNEREVARTVLEPFLNAGYQPLHVRPVILPLKTRISMTARALSAEDPDPVEANRLYDLLDGLPADL